MQDNIDIIDRLDTLYNKLAAVGDLLTEAPDRGGLAGLVLGMVCEFQEVMDDMRTMQRVG